MFFLVMRTLRIYLLTDFHILYSRGSNSYIVHYIPSAYLLHNWKFALWDYFHPFPTISGNHKSDLFFYEFVCFEV